MRDFLLYNGFKKGEKMATKKAVKKTKQNTYQYIDPLMIKLAPTFQNAFDINKTTKENIVKSISENGWDKDQPVIIWHETGILIDGHTRRESAIECGLSRITYIDKSFSSEQEAFNYIQGLQFNRRNLTDKDKLQIIFMSQDGMAKAKNKKKYIAELLRCSERSAAKYMKIMKDPQKVSAILDDKETVNTALAVKTDQDRKNKYMSVIRRIEKANDITADEVAELEKVLKELKKKIKKEG